MDNLGLSATDLQTYFTGICGDHERRIDVEIQTLAQDPVANLNQRILDGQISVDRTGSDEVSRVLTMRFADPNQRLDLSPTSPGEGAIHFQNMVQIIDRRWISGLGWVSAYPFVGPVWDFERDGDEVSITCHSKERIAMGALYEPLTLKKGTTKVAAIRTIMGRTGEDRFALPADSERIPKTVSLDRTASPWFHAKRLADSMNMQLFYDGRGFLRLRHWPNVPTFTFSSDPPRSLLSNPKIRRSLEGFPNKVVVLGAHPKGKPRVRGEWTAPADLAPLALGRNGQQRYVEEREENPHFRTNSAAKARADQIGASRLAGMVETSFDAVPVSNLDAGDLCRLQAEDGAVNFRLNSFVIPLTTEGEPVMSVGEVRRVQRR